MNIQLPPVGISGRYRMVVSNDAELKDVKQEFEFANLITDVGMNRIGTVNTNKSQATGLVSFQDLCGRFVVGAGNAPPDFTDTALQSPIAFHTSDVTLDSESSSYSRGWYEITVRSQFGQGVAEGNLSEIGIQHTSTSGPLWSRALILDGAGNPTTITVTDMDFLTCYYTLRIYIPQEDYVFNTVVEYDDIEVPTEVTIRPIMANSADAVNGWGLQTYRTGGGSAGNSYFYFHNGGLTAPTATSLAGSMVGGQNGNNRQIVPYVHNSFEARASIGSSLSQQNSNQLATCLVNMLMGCWQVNFNPPLQKNNTQTMNITFGYSWARA